MKYKYIGFLSYAHADEAIASRLHRALETYSIPKNLELKDVKKLSPIFRDTTELTAHHDLSEKIREAVERSKYLIVLCSPAAKQSHWVNEEIRLFRKLHGEASILCVLAEGTPDTSFPPALLEGGREPLAANLSGGKDSFKLGTTQLAASMLGVGLDTLIQRESKRRRRHLQIITAAALTFSGIMGVTAFTAVEARNEAQDSRAQAEGLVEYMITDLKDKLEPVGRLDILDSVGDKAVEYYDRQDIRKLSDESLARQARARHVLGQVALESNRKTRAIREIKAAAKLTKETLDRNTNDAIAIYAHAQSEYWIGKLYRDQSNWEGVSEHWSAYKLLTQKLYKKNPKNVEWIMEAGYGENNLGNLARVQENYKTALIHFKAAIEFYNKALLIEPNNNKNKMSLANALAGAARSAAFEGKSETALKYRTEQIKIYDEILMLNPNNYNLIFRRANAQAGLIILIPTKSPIFSSTVNDIQKSMKLCIDHDPQNVRWKKEYKAFKVLLSQKYVSLNSNE